jgi:hypothetical protein
VIPASLDAPLASTVWLMTFGAVAAVNGAAGSGRAFGPPWFGLEFDDDEDPVGCLTRVYHVWPTPTRKKPVTRVATT